MDISELKNRKNKLKLTTHQLAELAGAPYSTVSKIMTGETKNPSYVIIDKIDKALSNEEMKIRLKTYADEWQQHIKEHSKEDVDQWEFEKEYRKKHHLSDDPIPYAVSVTDKDYDYAMEMEKTRGKRVTAEILSMFDEKQKIELLDGRLIFNNSPTLEHQNLVMSIGKKIDRFIDDNHGKCRMINVDVDVRLDEDDYTVLIPDIMVICNPEIIRNDGVWGVPDWVVEVTSPSTKKMDYGRKMHKYLLSGVREYWIVDPQEEKVVVYTEGELVVAHLYSFEDEIPVYIYDGKLKIKIR